VGGLVGLYFRAYRWRWLSGLAFTVCSTSLGLVTPWLLRQAIDSFATQQGSQVHWPLHWFAGAIVVVAIAEAGCRFLSRLIITGASRWVEYDLRNRYFEHLETLEPAFFVRYRTGDLVARGINDLSAVRQLFGPALYHTLNTSLLMLIALVLMFQLSPGLATWAALVVPAATTLYVLTHKRIEQRFTRVQEQFAAMSDHAHETFAGQRVVKAYAQEPAEAEAFRRTSHEYVSRQLSQIRLTGLLWPTMSMVVGMLTVLILYMGGREVVSARLTVGEFVQFMAYVAMLTWPMMALGWVGTMWQQGTASLRRIHEVLSTVPTIRTQAEPRRWQPQGKIEFRNVGLVIDDHTILQDVNLTIPAGATYAIVGPLGSGKSSLVSLIPRLQDVTSGQVLIDDIDVRDLPQSDLRRQVGVVLQDPFLFTGTLAHNIRLNETRIDDEQVRQAARYVHADEFIARLPDGYDTPVKERGAGLSVGQKQLIAFARAVAFNPAMLLVLDEATANVDTETEWLIQRGLERLMQGRTSIIIAHRLSTIRQVDRILVMHKGKLVEEGTHAALLEHNGLYARLYELQYRDQEAVSL